ncbi:MAG: hypothetical protein H3C47_01775 [Candidatus Cloacimonetes bacterium]|nr:hypothetical protein [Candidatus Cloacimonadota bacterium]
MILILDTLAKKPVFWLQTKNRVFTSSEIDTGIDDIEGCLKNIWEGAGLKPSELQMVAFNRGPGSFTGIKTGSVIAGSMALFGAKLMSYTTFDWMQVLLGRPVENELLLLNAFQGDYFQARRKNGVWDMKLGPFSDSEGSVCLYFGDKRFLKPQFVDLSPKEPVYLKELLKENLLTNEVKPLYLKKSYAEINREHCGE